jgi:hypothetical protein
VPISSPKMISMFGVFPVAIAFSSRISFSQLPSTS